MKRTANASLIEASHDHCSSVACVASTLDYGLDKVRPLLSEALAQGAEIVCFPEAYLPGLRGQDFEALLFDQSQQKATALLAGR